MAHSISRFDIVGLGHALLDSFVACEDHHLPTLGLIKGAMNPVHEDHADQLAQQAHSSQPGGSMANSLAVASSIGASTAFICRTGRDEAGEHFIRGMSAAGVAMIGTPPEDGKTGRCVVHVTPDAERTMATSLGVCRDIAAEDARHPAIAGARVLAFDGYMLDDPKTRAIALSAILEARTAGDPVMVATSLGDAASATRNKALIRELVRVGYIDVLFGNEREATAYLDHPLDHPDLAGTIGGMGLNFFLTRGAKGASWIGRGMRVDLPAEPIQRLVDTTGAGDAFAGGVLFGLARGYLPDHATRIGLAAAAEIIQQTGAQPKRALTHLSRLMPRATTLAGADHGGAGNDSAA